MKQEVIKEGLARELCYEWWNPLTEWEDLDDMLRKPYYHLADAVLSYLNSQGVVIKVCDRDVGGGFVGSYTRPEVLAEVEPLI